MKKFFTLVAAIAIAALSMVSSKTYASHAVGADLTYQYVGPNQYLLTLRFYRDCAGISAPPTVNIGYFSSCFPSGSITLNPIPGTGLEIPPSNCLPPTTTWCNGGTGYGVQEFIYQGLLTLPGPCADWRFDYSECCRNAAITTIINPDSYNLYVASTLDNFNFPTNSSPVFANIPVTQFCVGNQFFYNQGATDIDGDSLNFYLDIAENTFGVSLPYAPGYSALTPLASSTPITCDPFTGTISFTPSQQQVGVIAIVCEEYRNGIKIGQIKRDIQMNVVAGCIGSAPIFADPVDPSGNPAPFYTANCGDTSIYIILDSPIQCGSVVPTDIRILTPGGQLNPVLTATPVNCSNGVTDSILVTFFYPLTAGTTYAFTKVGFDNNTFLSECGVEMPEFDSLAYNVVDPGVFNTAALNVGCSFNNITLTFDYDIVCSTLTSSGTEFFIVDANGVVYPVTGISNCPGGANSYTSTLTFDLGGNIAPATPCYLIVQNGSDQNTFTNRCNTFILPGDTLAVLNVLNSLIVNLGTDPTICDTDPLPTLDAGVTNATYTWTLNGNTLPDQTQTINASQAGIYIVNVGVTPVCQGADTLVVTINPSPVVALGNDVSLCDTDPIPTFDAGNPGATYQWYSNGVLIPGETLQFFQPLVAGTYSVVVTSNTCSGTDEIVVIINQNLTVTLGNDQTLCSTDPLPVLDAGVPNGSYVWTLNGNPVGANTQTLQTTGAGSYSVAVTSISGCTGTANVTVNIVQAPTVTLSNATVCPGAAFPVLDAGNAGSTFLWSTGEITQTIAPTTAGVYTVTVTAGSGLNCSATSSATYANSNPVVVSLGNDLTACIGDASLTIDAGNTGSSYVWSLDGSVLSGQTSQTIQVNQAGLYSVLVTDANGCTGTDDATFTVNSLPVIELGVDVAICPGEVLPTLNATNPDASTYSWSFDGTVVGSGPTYDATAFGTYVVTIVDNNGCIGTDQLTINEAPCEIVIPNVFTPGNGDGLNDIFFIKNLETNPNTSVLIFSRWGKEVYSSGNYLNNWDGGNLPDGTYFYTVVLQSGKDYKGTVKIIRKK